MENRLKNSGFRLSNSFLPSNTGLITTFAQGTQEQDVRKSRIQHLPSYRKGDLSDKLQFVVVFQTIEIERLSIEIQSLRVKLKDSDRQIRIYLNYQVQIKELTQNCHQLQQERAYYQNQVEQMSLACNSLYEELTQNKKNYEKQIQDLKRKFSSSQAQLQKDNQNQQQVILKLQSQLLKKSQSEANAENKIKFISQQLDRANQNLRKNENEIVLLKDKESKKAQQLRKAQRQSQQRQREQQSTINGLMEQNQQLAGQVDKKKAQIITITNNWEKDNRVLDNSKKQLEYSKKETQNIKSRLQQLQNQYNRKINDLAQSENANEQLKSQLKLTSIDLGRQKDKYQQMSAFANELKARIQSKSKQIQSFKKYLMGFEQECQNNSKRQAELIRKMALLEPVLTQISSLQQKIFQLNNKLSEKELELNGKQRFIVDLTIQNKELAQIRKQLQVKAQRGIKQVRQLEDQIQAQRRQSDKQKKQQANDYQRKIEKLTQEKKLINSQKDKLENEIERLRSEGLIKEQMKFQIKRLKDNCKRQERDIQAMNARLQNISSLIAKLKEKHSQFNEIQKTNSLLKKQLDSSFTLIDKMIQKIGAYEQQIENLTDENWRLTDKLKEEYYKDEYFSTSSSAKTIQSQYTTPTLINSTRFSSIQQSKPFEPFGFGNSDYIPSTTLSGSNVRQFPMMNQNLNLFRSKLFQGDADSKNPSRQNNVYSSMIGQYSSKGGLDSQNNWERR